MTVPFSVPFSRALRPLKKRKATRLNGGLPLGDQWIIDPFPSGRLLRTEVIEELGLTVTKAAQTLEVRRATLSDLLNGKAALSPEMALRIEKAFDVSMDMLLRMQAWYDASQMRARAGEITVQRYVRLEKVTVPLLLQ